VVTRVIDRAVVGVFRYAFVGIVTVGFALWASGSIVEHVAETMFRGARS
jgi:hypothetical protein